MTSIFAEAVLASLRRQRSLSSPFCDVLLRCGNVTIATHGSVLAAVSRFFEKLLVVGNLSVSLAASSVSHQKLVDLSSVFKGVESFFPEVIDSLYVGKRVFSATSNHLLKAVYDRLDLKLRFSEGSSTNADATNIDIQNIVTTSSSNPVTKPFVKKDEKEVRMDMSVCPKCDLFFVSKEEFISHRNSHCGRGIACLTCAAIFPRVQALIGHLIDVRHGEIECSVCRFYAKSQKDLEAHLQRHAESMDKPYFCIHCDARFSTRKRWVQHLPRHSTETPFVCPVCSKGFKWKHALTAHLVIHSSEKKFLCQECGFSTSHASTLRFHTRMHAGNLMKCDVKECTFQTTRKSNLVQHKLTHSKEKPHQCEVCGRSFSLAKNMRRHAKQHDLSASAYTCTEAECSFSTLRSDKFYEHVRKYHTPSSTPISQAAPSEPKEKVSCRSISVAAKLEKSPFNMVSPPNKSVIDAMHGTFSDVNQIPIEEPSAELAEGKIIVVDDLGDAF